MVVISLSIKSLGFMGGALSKAKIDFKELKVVAVWNYMGIPLNTSANQNNQVDLPRLKQRPHDCQ